MRWILLIGLLAGGVRNASAQSVVVRPAASSSHDAASSWEVQPWFQVTKDAETRPAVAPRELGAQFAIGVLTGGIAGLAGAVAGAGLGERSCAMRADSGLFCGLGHVLVGFSIGEVLGSAVGVQMVGRGNTWRTPLYITLGGSVGGLIGGYGLLSLTDDGSRAGLILVLAMPTLGAMVAYNSARRYRPAALVTHDLRRADWTIHLPHVQLQSDPLGQGTLSQGRALALAVPLVHLTF